MRAKYNATPRESDTNHRMKVVRINFLLGAQNFVDCLRRHAPRIQIAKMTVAVPVAAIKIESKAIKLVGFSEIFGIKPTTNEGTIKIPIIMR